MTKPAKNMKALRTSTEQTKSFRLALILENQKPNF